MSVNLRKRKNTNSIPKNSKQSKINEECTNTNKNLNHAEDFIHPNLIIVQHFDEIKNQIDIETETCLQNLILKSQEESTEEEVNLNNEKQNNLSNQRQKQLEKIDQVQDKNLERVKFDKEKWTHVLDDVLMTYEQKLEIIKENIISFDCLRINDEQYTSDFYLWIVPWFYNEKNLKFLK